MNTPISVLQDWVQRLSFMQQSVIIASIRGPDGIEKNHVSKLLIRWLRRCTLYSAFESKMNGKPTSIDDPVKVGGGSFTGPSTADENWHRGMANIVAAYLSTIDGVPHHFQLHFMHAAEIIGYKHPDAQIRQWWRVMYCRLANDMHLNPETEEQMDRRLGDFEANWRAAEEVVAEGPTS